MNSSSAQTNNKNKSNTSSKKNDKKAATAIAPTPQNATLGVAPSQLTLPNQLLDVAKAITSTANATTTGEKQPKTPTKSHETSTTLPATSKSQAYAEETESFCSLRLFSSDRKEQKHTFVSGLYYFHVAIVYKTMSSVSSLSNFELLQSFWLTFEEVFDHLPKYSYWQKRLFKYFYTPFWPKDYIDYRNEVMKGWKDIFDRGYPINKLPIEFIYPSDAPMEDVKKGYFGYRIKDHGDRMKNIINNYLSKYYLEFEESIKHLSVLLFAVRKKYYLWKAEKKAEDAIRRKKRLRGKPAKKRKSSLKGTTADEAEGEGEDDNDEDEEALTLTNATPLTPEEEEKQEQAFKEQKIKDASQTWEKYDGKWFPHEWLAFILVGRPVDESALLFFKAEFKAKTMHHLTESDIIIKDDDLHSESDSDAMESENVVVAPIHIEYRAIKSTPMKEPSSSSLTATTMKMEVEDPIQSMKEDISNLKEAATAAENKKRLFVEMKDEENVIKSTKELIELYDMIQKKARALVK